jgi:LmbE family N-acetylglucosaminyl deacetylase
MDHPRHFPSFHLRELAHDLVPGGAHQDHREINQLTTNVFRDHLVLEYEIPKWDVVKGSFFWNEANGLHSGQFAY